MVVNDRIKEILKSISFIYKEINGEIQILCPFCDDAIRKSNIKWGHLYISKETGLFFCHRCSEKGNLIKLLNEYGIRDDEILRYLNSIYAKSRIITFDERKSSIHSNDSAIKEIIERYFTFKNSDSFRYVEKRLGIRSLQEYIYYRILLTENSVIFLNHKYEKVVERHIHGRRRYTSYNTIEYQLNVNKKVNGVLIVEGVFDLINLHRNIYYLNNYRYIAMNRRRYFTLVRRYNGFVDNIKLFIDNDIDPLKLKKKLFSMKLDSNVEIYYNKYGKDFNENLIKIEKIK